MGLSRLTSHDRVWVANVTHLILKTLLHSRGWGPQQPQSCVGDLRFLLSQWSSVHVGRPKKLGSDTSEGLQQQQQQGRWTCQWKLRQQAKNRLLSLTSFCLSCPQKVVPIWGWGGLSTSNKLNKKIPQWCIQVACLFSRTRQAVKQD